MKFTAGIVVILTAGICTVVTDGAPLDFAEVQSDVHTGTARPIWQCFEKCILQIAPKVLEWYSKCHLNITCWTHTGLPVVFRCLAACKAQDDRTQSDMGKITGELQSKEAVEKHFNFCMATCLAKSIPDIKKWRKKCKRKISCWVKKAGRKAIKCLSKCMLPWEEEMLLTDSHVVNSPRDTTMTEYEKRQEGPISIILCLAKCLGDDIMQIRKWYKECKTSIGCWIGKIGKAGLQCLKGCLLMTTQVNEPVTGVFHLEQKMPHEATQHTVVTDLRASPFIKCMGHCLGKDMADILKWYHECKTDVKCWVEKVGLEAVQCALKCAALHYESLMEDQEHLEPEDSRKRFVPCMAKCLGEQKRLVKEWSTECQKNVTCWESKAGKKAPGCLKQCRKPSIDMVTLTPAHAPGGVKTEKTVGEIAVKSFPKCMAKCLGKSLMQIMKWYKECGRDKKCWKKKAGSAAIKCMLKCAFTIPVPHEEGNTDWSPSAADSPSVDRSRSKFLTCVATCLGQQYVVVKAWNNECRTDVKCWESKAGKKAPECLKKCKKPKGDEVTSVPASNLDSDKILETEVTDLRASPFIKCMGHCLGKDMADILKWYHECKTDVKCWVEKVGLEAVQCALKCAALHYESLMEDQEHLEPEDGERSQTFHYGTVILTKVWKKSIPYAEANDRL